VEKMTDGTQEGEAIITITDATVYTLGTVNCIPIYEDMKYFLNKSFDQLLPAEERNRNARAAIIYMAFFVESLANYICLKHKVRVSEAEVKSSNLSKPIIMLQKIYKKALGKDMQLDIVGLQDIFFLRNKIIAHAKGITIKGSNVPDLITTWDYQYKVLRNPPNAYVDFKSAHAESLHNEMKSLLKKYFSLMGDKLPENIAVQIPLD
jgi:hypothetical protein